MRKHECEENYDYVVYYGSPDRDIWDLPPAWRFDSGDGLQGPVIKFCPFCGERLED